MPIKDPTRYPHYWKRLSQHIRFGRAKGVCECDGRCGDHELECTAVHGKPHPVTGSKVVLTVSHLDHTPENCDKSNLMAMCQKCHNNYDKEFRLANKRASKREEVLASGQMELGI